MRLRPLVAILGAAAALVFPSGAEAQSIGRSAGGLAPYALTIRAKQPRFRAGSPIWVEITVRNVSDREVEGLGADEAATDLFYSVEVRDSKGNAVPETQFERDVRNGGALWVGSSLGGLKERPTLLQPGRSRTVEIDVGRRFDLVQPGEYFVRVQRQRDRSGPVVKSSSIRITITK